MHIIVSVNRFRFYSIFSLYGLFISLSKLQFFSEIGLIIMSIAFLQRGPRRFARIMIIVTGKIF